MVDVPAEYGDEIRGYVDAVAELYSKLSMRSLKILREIGEDPFISDETNAILLLYRHACSLLDALAVLSGVPSVEGMKVVLRSFFEAKVSLEYILETETHSRAVAYQTYDIVNRRKGYRKLDRSTEPGKEFAARIKKDRLYPDDVLGNYDTAEAIANLERQLQREPFKSTYEELKAVKAAGRGSWYSIHGGPQSFEGLCERLGYQATYDLFYRNWSSAVHAESAYMDSYSVAEGEGRMYPGILSSLVDGHPIGRPILSGRFF